MIETIGLNDAQIEIVKKFDDEGSFGVITKLALNPHKTLQGFMQCTIYYGLASMSQSVKTDSQDEAFFLLLTKALLQSSKALKSNLEKLKKFDKYKNVIVDGKLYLTDDKSHATPGFGGHKWTIKHNDGSIQVTRSLWLDSSIDPRLRSLYPDTAKFVPNHGETA